jgi:hypothetical protein
MAAGSPYEPAASLRRGRRKCKLYIASKLTGVFVRFTAEYQTNPVGKLGAVLSFR